MSIENTLERIAVALEKLAAGTGPQVVHATKPPVTTQVGGVETAGTARTDTTGVDDSSTEETKIEEPSAKPLSWGDVSKELFAALTEVKTVKGLDAAKAISAALAKKYSNGVPPTAANTDPAQYNNFRVDIRLAKAEAMS